MLLFSLGHAAALPAAQPNVVLILANDLGCGDVGSDGAAKVKTPNIDWLAAQWHTQQAVHTICGALRGRRHSVYEGGFRGLFIVRWPGRVPAGKRSETPLGLTDVLATCAARLGDKLPADAGEDRFDALPAWRGEPGAHVRASMILEPADGVFAIREGPWKLIELNAAPPANGKARPTKADAENRNPFFTLADDPAQMRNLWTAQPEIVPRLSILLAEARTHRRTAPLHWTTSRL
jgi:arylsulfatase A-like enzyme